MSRFTLAQALRHQSKLKGQISELNKRAEASITYLDESPPAFEFAKVVEQLDRLRSELTVLETRISLTNAATPAETPRGAFRSTTELVKRLQELRSKLAWYRGLSVKPRAETTEYTHDYDDDGKRIRVAQKWSCALPEAQRVEVVDALQREFDELNGAVERINNATLLLEEG